MNKKGQTIGFAILFAVIIFMVGVLILPFIGDEVTRTTSSDQLDCNNSTISDGTKLTCLAVDIVIPYFVIGILAIVGSLTITRFLSRK